MSKYLTSTYATQDLDRVLGFVARFPFATLIPEGGVPGPLSSVPLLRDDSDDTGGAALYGHLDRHNPVLSGLDGARLVALFHGPNGYISPTDYRTRQFPTWNYATAQVHGTCRLIDEHERKLHYMRRTVTELEQRNESCYQLDESEALMHSKLRLVVFFRLEISRVHGTFKFAQEKTLEDRTRARDGLIRKLHAGQRRAIPALADLDHLDHGDQR